MGYLYLALIPNLIVIAFLLFNKEAKAKYKTKKAVVHLSLMFISMLILISLQVRFYYRWLPGTNPWGIGLLVFAFLVILAPIFIPTLYKINRKETVFDKKWVQILSVVVTIIVFFLISFFVMK